MEIRYHKAYMKSFKKLPSFIKPKVLQTVELFIRDPIHPSLHNHPLTGKLAGRRAVSVTSNIRIVFEEYNDYTLVLFLDVGTHNQVYR